MFVAVLYAAGSYRIVKRTRLVVLSGLLFRSNLLICCRSAGEGEQAVFLFSVQKWQDLVGFEYFVGITSCYTELQFKTALTCMNDG